jgi:phosphonoacetaldehyde hydrolase
VPTPLQLVVFDLAGTVVDFGSTAPVEAFVRTFAERGVEATGEEARGPMGVDKRTHLRAMASLPSIAERWRKIHGRDCAEADIDEMYHAFMPIQLAALRDRSTLVPGAQECLIELRTRGLKVAANTGYFRDAAQLVLAAAKEQGFEVDVSACVDDVPTGRPAPWMIFRCMEGMGVFPPSSVVKVGDTVPDVLEGLNAGAWSIGVAGTSSEVGLTEEEFARLSQEERESKVAAARRKLRSAGAHCVIDALEELPALLDDLALRLTRGERP